MANAPVAAALGHSCKTHLAGVTADYVGSISEDLWTAMIEEDYNDPFSANIGNIPYVSEPRMKERMKLSQSEITTICTEQVWIHRIGMPVIKHHECTKREALIFG